MAVHADAAGNPAYVFAAALFEELARAGVRDVCLCPGSRSAPLAVAASREPGVRTFAHVDERAAAFFALGLAKASRAPVSILCTSGTAAANLLPAVVEAHYAQLPLVVLTADRPPELRDCGADQTIDQVRLFGSHVRWYAESAMPEATEGMLRYARALASRAVAEALGPPAGPVHLNLPFREPLEPRAASRGAQGVGSGVGARGRGERGWANTRRAPIAPTPDLVTGLAERAARCPRGVIACGPLDAGPDFAESLGALARRAGWPILADATSQLRCGPHVEGAPLVAHADLLLRDSRFAAAHAPELVLRVGAPPVSKALRLWLEHHAPAQFWLLDPDGSARDPSHLASDLLRVDLTLLCSRLARALEARAAPPGGDAWLQAFLRADRRAADAIERRLAADDALLEPRVVRELAEALPDDALLYVSNSLPVRDVDAFLPVSSRPLRVLANRGANGIDGMLSSALGAAAAGAGPVALLTGDLAFLHDLGGLLAASRHGVAAAIVVLNNDGGGIFSYLPIAAHGAAVDFEANFRTPHGLDLAPACRTFGVQHVRVTSWDHLRFALKEAFASERCAVIEVPVDPEQSVAQHRALFDAVARANRPANPAADGVSA
jgi:2-succinyl-5-enolpyruvyl-6-hydroxy-3-cyclohexene-1-carboxylate synthase